MKYKALPFSLATGMMAAMAIAISPAQVNAQTQREWVCETVWTWFGPQKNCYWKVTPPPPPPSTSSSISSQSWSSSAPTKR